MTLRTQPRLLAAAWLGLACYCLLSLAFGKGGFLASTSSAAELVAMKDNIQSLSSLNGRLSTEIAALQNDPDKAMREALPIGWLAKGDYEIVLPNRKESPKPTLSPGSVLPASDPSGLADLDIKATSLIVTIIAFGLSLLRDAHGSEKRAAGRKRGKESSKPDRLRNTHPRPTTTAAESPINDDFARAL